MSTPLRKPVIGRYGNYQRWFSAPSFLLVAGSLARPSDDGKVLAVLYAVLGAAWLFMPLCQITDTGVRLATVRPWRREVPFQAVAAVLKPASSDVNRGLELRLHDGDIVVLRNVPAEQAQALAALAGVPVETMAHRRPSTAGAPLIIERAAEDPNRPLTDRELERRFGELEQQRKALADKLARRQPPD